MVALFDYIGVPLNIDILEPESVSGLGVYLYTDSISFVENLFFLSNLEFKMSFCVRL
jgi:hypothetical protein